MKSTRQRRGCWWQWWGSCVCGDPSVVVLSDFYPYNNIASVLIQRSAWNVDQLRGGWGDRGEVGGVDRGVVALCVSLRESKLEEDDDVSGYEAKNLWNKRMRKKSEMMRKETWGSRSLEGALLIIRCLGLRNILEEEKSGILKSRDIWSQRTVKESRLF